jgi:hypothetical protein
VRIEQILDSVSITDVWVTLGGDVPKNGRASAFYRGGDNKESVSIEDDKGVWYDHRDNMGGGILSLIQHVLACGKREAARWLSDFTGLPLDDKLFTPIQREDYARRKSEDQRIAQDVNDFREGLRMYLEQRSDKYGEIVTWQLEHLPLEVEPPSFGMLMEAHRLRDILRSASHADVLRMYQQSKDEERERFREMGKLHREQSESITRDVVDLLAYSSQ